MDQTKPEIIATDKQDEQNVPKFKLPLRFIFITLIVCLFLTAGYFGIQYYLPSSLKFAQKTPVAPSRISQLLLNPKTTKQAHALDVIEGHAIANAKVRVYLTPGDTTQELITDESGNWKFQIPKELKKGKYTLSVSVLDTKDNLVSIKSYPFEIDSEGAKKTSLFIPNIVYAKESDAKTPSGYSNENWDKVKASMDEYGIHMEYENGEFIVYDAKKWVELCQYDCAKFKIGDHYGEPTPERLEALNQENIDLIRSLVDYLYLNGYRGISVIKNAVFPPIKDGKDPQVNSEIVSLLGLEEDVKFEDPNFIAAYNILADQFAQKLAAKVGRSDFVPFSINPGEQIIAYEGRTYQLSNPNEPCTPKDQMSEEDFKQTLLFVQQNSPLSTVKILEKQVDDLVSTKNSKYMPALIDETIFAGYEPYYAFEPYFPGYIRNKPRDLACNGANDYFSVYDPRVCDGGKFKVPTPEQMKELMIGAYNKRISQITRSEAAKKYAFENPLWGFVLSKPANTFLGTRAIFKIALTDQEATLADGLDAVSGAIFMLGPFGGIARGAVKGGAVSLANVAMPALKATGSAGRRILFEAGGGMPLKVLEQELRNVSFRKAQIIAGETFEQIAKGLAKESGGIGADAAVRAFDVTHESDPNKGAPQTGLTISQARPNVGNVALTAVTLAIIVTKTGIENQESQEKQEHGQAGIETHVSVEYKGQKPAEKDKQGFRLVHSAYAALADTDSEYVGLNINSVDTLPESEANCSLSECEVKLPENPLPGDYVIRVYAVDKETGEILAADSVDYFIPKPVNELLKVTLINADNNEQELYHKDKANLEDFNENGFRPINLYGLQDGLNAFRLVVYYTDGRTETFDPNKLLFTINISHPEPTLTEEPSADIAPIPEASGLTSGGQQICIDTEDNNKEYNEGEYVRRCIQGTHCQYEVFLCGTNDWEYKGPEEDCERCSDTSSGDGAAIPPVMTANTKPKIVTSKCGADNGNTIVLIDDGGNEIPDTNCSDMNSTCQETSSEDGNSSNYVYCASE